MVYRRCVPGRSTGRCGTGAGTGRYSGMEYREVYRVVQGCTKRLGGGEAAREACSAEHDLIINI